MKTASPKECGTVLVFALLIMVVGAGVLAGLAQLTATQALSGEEEWDAAARRINLENSRALAREFVLSWMAEGYGRVPWLLGDSSDLKAALTNIVTNDLGIALPTGGFELTSANPEAGFWLSVPGTDLRRVNPYNLFERGGFQSSWIEGGLWNGSTPSNNVLWAFQVRTRSPITAGYTFVSQLPDGNIVDITPTPRIRITNGGYSENGYGALPRMPIASGTNSSGGANPFSGFLTVPQGQDRFYDAPEDAVLLPNLTGVTNNVTNVIINLEIFNYTSLTSARRYEVPATCVRLELIGSASAGLPLQISAGSSLTNLVLSGAGNIRPVYFYREGANNNLQVTGSGTWTLGMTLKARAEFDAGLVINGGIRTDAQISGMGAINPTRSTNVNWDAIADRVMWLEDTRLYR